MNTLLLSFLLACSGDSKDTSTADGGAADGGGADGDRKSVV